MDYAHPQPSPSAISERVLREQVAGVYATIGTASLADSVLAISVSVGYAWLTQSWWPLVWLMLHTAQALRYPVLGPTPRARATSNRLSSGLDAMFAKSRSTAAFGAWRRGSCWAPSA